VGTHQFGHGGVGNLLGKAGEVGRDGQRWAVTAAWQGKDQGAGECPPGRDTGDGYMDCE